MADADLVALAEAAARGGAAAFEIGIPFSDPLADGSDVQRAASGRWQRDDDGASDGGDRRRARAGQVPLVPMTYASPVMAYGERRFCADAAAAGADGLIVPDVPRGRGRHAARRLRGHGLDLVPLLAPTAVSSGSSWHARHAGGFVYLVSVAGMTGARDRLSDRVAGLIERVRPHTPLPLLVGFGISSPDAARAALEAGADGVIIGSKAIEVAEAGGPAALERFCREIAAALIPVA